MAQALAGASRVLILSLVAVVSCAKPTPKPEASSGCGNTGSVGALLARPSERAFEIAWERLGRCVDPRTLEAALSSWPESAREAPDGLVAAAMRGESSPWLGEVRVLSLSSPIESEQLPSAMQEMLASAHALTLTDLSVSEQQSVTRCDCLGRVKHLRLVNLEATSFGNVISELLRTTPNLQTLEVRIRLRASEEEVVLGSIPHSLAELRNLTGLHSLRLRNLRIELPDAMAIGPRGSEISVQSLDLQNASIADEALQYIASAPSYAGLVRLGLSGTWLSPTALRVLGSSETLTLKRLDLSRRWFGDLKAKSIASGPLLSSVEYLDLSRNQDSAPPGPPLGPDGVRAIVKASPNLVAIDLSERPIGAPGARALEHISDRLTTLKLNDCELGEPGAEALTRIGSLGKVQVLELANNDIGERGLRMLADAGAFRSVRELDLSGNNIGPDGLRALLSTGVAGRLERLSIRGNPVGPEGLQAIAGEEWPNLRLLNLSSGTIRHSFELRPLLKAAMPMLDRLTITHNGLDDVGLEILSQWRGAPALRILDASYNSGGDDGAVLLATSSAYPWLEVLDLGSYQITDSAASRISTACIASPVLDFRVGWSQLTASGLRDLAFSECVPIWTTREAQQRLRRLLR